MKYQPRLEFEALRHMGGIPDHALDVIVQVVAEICENPYNRMVSMPVRDDDPGRRMAELGDWGFIEFRVDEAEGLIRIYSVVWLG